MPDRDSPGSTRRDKASRAAPPCTSAPRSFAGYRRARSRRQTDACWCMPILAATNVIGPLGKSVFGTYVAQLMRPLPRLSGDPPAPAHDARSTSSTIAARPATSYDAVLLHCGIVDFSPRPVSSIPRIAAAKSGDPGFAELFAENAGYHREATGPQYGGEPTTTLYSPRYLERRPRSPPARRFPRLVWVTTNDFVPGWEGNYTRGRPVDIGRAHRRVRGAAATGARARRRHARVVRRRGPDVHDRQRPLLPVRRRRDGADPALGARPDASASATGCSAW